MWIRDLGWTVPPHYHTHDWLRRPLRVLNDVGEIVLKESFVTGMRLEVVTLVCLRVPSAEAGVHCAIYAQSARYLDRADTRCETGGR